MASHAVQKEEYSEKVSELFQMIYDGSFKDRHSLEVAIGEFLPIMNPEEREKLRLALQDCRPELLYLLQP